MWGECVDLLSAGVAHEVEIFEFFVRLKVSNGLLECIDIDEIHGQVQLKRKEGKSDTRIDKQWLQTEREIAKQGKSKTEDRCSPAGEKKRQSQQQQQYLLLGRRNFPPRKSRHSKDVKHNPSPPDFHAAPPYLCLSVG